MKATCPGCGFSGDLEAFINDAHWRAALVPALSLPGELAPYVLQYLRLFSPAKQGLRAERAGKILAELADWISQARVERNGVQRVAPLPLWKEGIEEVLLARDAGTLELPFKGHGYLFKVVHSLAGKAAGREERSKENRAQGNTPIGTSAAHKPFPPNKPAERKPARNPAAAAKALADMKTTLTKGAKQ